MGRGGAPLWGVLRGEQGAAPRPGALSVQASLPSEIRAEAMPPPMGPPPALLIHFRPFTTEKG